MATVDELIVEIRAETKELRQGLDDVNRQLKGATGAAEKSLISFSNLAKVFAAVGVAAAGANMVKTIREFEDLGAILKAVTGSAEAAGVSMEVIERFTAGTTFQLNDVTQAFTTLVNAGITPTTGVLTDFGNVAAAFGKDITTMAQAAFNATTGEMEMLKQFGIIAKVEGDKLAVTFDNTTTKIDRNSTAIIEFIRKVGRDKFPTALEDSANTLSGKISNLQDATASFYNEIGDAGLRQALTDFAGTFLDMSQNSANTAQVIGRTLTIAVRGLNRIVIVITENLRELLGAIVLLASVATISAISKLGLAFVALARSVGIARAAMILLNASMKKSIFVGAAVVIGYFTGGLERLGEMAEKAAAAVGDLLGDVFDGGAEGTDEFTQSIDELNSELENLIGTSEKIPEVAKGTQTVAESFEGLRDSITSTTQAFTFDLVNALLESGDALQSFRDLAKNIVAQIIGTFLQMAVVNRILNAVFGDFSGWQTLPTIGGGGGGGGGGTVPITTAGTPPGIQNAGNSLNIPMPVVTPSAPAQMMSRASAPALSIPPVEVNIPPLKAPEAPARMMSRASAPVVINQSLNFSTGVVPTVRAEVTRMLPQISDVTKASVLEAASRGGSFQRGLVGA